MKPRWSEWARSSDFTKVADRTQGRRSVPGGNRHLPEHLLSIHSGQIPYFLPHCSLGLCPEKGANYG